MTDFVKRRSGLLVPAAIALVGGVFHGKILREGKVIDEWEQPNIVTNQGLDYMLGATFGTVQPISSWFLAPFGGNYTPVGTDTAANISASATEVSTYTSQTRVPFTPVEGNQQATNTASPATFTFNSKTNVYGAFLISSGAIGGTTGTLLAAAQFASLKSPDPADQLILTYTFAAASA